MLLMSMFFFLLLKLQNNLFTEEMDFSKLSLHQAKRLEVESQVRDLFIL